MYSSLGRLDATFGAASWDEALAWIAGVQPGEPIGEVQYWGHGKWGSVQIADERLSASALRERHPLHSRLCGLRERLAPEALLWFRTCETFGAKSGIDFARRCTDFFGVRAAGHTHVIHYWQSGLHGLTPGHVPDWRAADGLIQGTPEEPRSARTSSPLEPRTITCTQGTIPARWFA